MLPIPICPYCNKAAELVDGTAVYPHRSDLAHKRFWLCKPCDAWVGTHRDSKKHLPLGRLADKELREAKRSPPMPRSTRCGGRSGGGIAAPRKRRDRRRTGGSPSSSASTGNDATSA